MQTRPGRRLSLATNDRRDGQVGAHRETFLCSLHRFGQLLPVRSLGSPGRSPLCLPRLSGKPHRPRSSDRRILGSLERAWRPVRRTDWVRCREDQAIGKYKSRASLAHARLWTQRFNSHTQHERVYVPAPAPIPSRRRCPLNIPEPMNGHARCISSIPRMNAMSASRTARAGSTPCPS